LFFFFFFFFFWFLFFFLLFSAICIGVGSTGVFGHYGAFKVAAHIDQRCFAEMESGKMYTIFGSIESDKSNTYSILQFLFFSKMKNLTIIKYGNIPNTPATSRSATIDNDRLPIRPSHRIPCKIIPPSPAISGYSTPTIHIHSIPRIHTMTRSESSISPTSNTTTPQPNTP